MQISDVALVCADNVRARCYMQAFTARKLLPAFCLILPAAESGNPDPRRRRLSPAEVPWGRFDPERGIRELCEEAGVPCEFAPAHDINAPETIRHIAELTQQVCVYAGFGGVILRADLLNCGKKFLHAHGGWLPSYKGSTTNYYSALQENFCAASAMFLNEEIDHGVVLCRRRFAVPADMSLMDYVHDNVFRAEVLCEVLAAHVKSRGWPESVVENTPTNPYFVMHPLLRHMAILGSKGADLPCA